MALSLLSQAANGTTFEEIRKVLNLNHDKAIVATQFHDYLELLQRSAYGSQLLFANRIYVPKGFQPRKTFQTVAAEKFASDIDTVDFNKPNDAAQTINQFVKKKTNEKITAIVKPEEFDTQTGAILINAITLKSKWSCPYSIEDTTSIYFFFNNVPDKLGLAVTDYMNTIGSFPTFYSRELRAKALKMDYKNSSLSLIIIMPFRGDYDTLEARIRNYTLAKVIDQMGTEGCSLEHGKLKVRIPKFKIETELNLNDALKKVCTKDNDLELQTISINISCFFFICEDGHI